MRMHYVLNPVYAETTCFPELNHRRQLGLVGWIKIMLTGECNFLFNIIWNIMRLQIGA